MKILNKKLRVFVSVVIYFKHHSSWFLSSTSLSCLDPPEVSQHNPITMEANLQSVRRITARIFQNCNDYNRTLMHVTGRVRDICGSPNSWIPMHVISSICISNKEHRTITVQQAIDPEWIFGLAHQVTCYCTAVFQNSKHIHVLTKLQMILDHLENAETMLLNLQRSRVNYTMKDKQFF